MKQFFIAALAIVGAYAVYQWVEGKQGSPRNAGGHNTGPWPRNLNTGAPPGNGVGDYILSDVSSGVPGYNQTPVEAGHGDQQAASKHSNPFATVTPNGGGDYTPAFGPNENQNPNTYVAVTV